MDREQVPSPRGGGRARKRAGRRARGLEVTERDGNWHVIGTIRAGGRSIRLRRSLGLSATVATYDAAWDEVRRLEAELRADATGGRVLGDPVAIAARAYLTKSRRRPLGPASIRIVKEIVARFGPRRLNEIPEADWRNWVDARHADNKSETRERFLGTVCAVLNYAARFHKMTVKVTFDRDKEARNPRRRKRRRVDELRPDLIGRLFGACHITLRAQLAAEWSTGARVSSVLYGVRICDVMLARGRETIVFNATKNGDDVPAALHPAAAAVLLEYAQWRGGLQDREAPFFLTHRRVTYVDNGRASGGQNKTAFRAARRRACRGLLAEAFAASREARHAGQRAAALDILLAARADARLLRRVTQHWFRHLLATRMRHDLRAAMEQGGWRDERSILGYVRDVPEARRGIVASFESFDTSKTRDPDKEAASA